MGETRSCGTGVCAAVVAAVAWADGDGLDDPWTVDVPGGRLTVTWLSAGPVLLSGPAVLVARGEVDPAALSRRDRPAVTRPALAGRRWPLHGAGRRGQLALNCQLWLPPAAGSSASVGSWQSHCCTGAPSLVAPPATSRHLPLCAATICT